MTIAQAVPGKTLPRATFRLRAGWLIDGLGGPARPHALLEVRDGLISKVEPDSSAPGTGDLVDFSPATIMPMLMDAHVHLALSGTWDARQRTRQLTFDHFKVRAALRQHLKASWRHGVGAVREAGDQNAGVWHNLRHTPPKAIPPVKTVLTRWAWHAAGRYGAMIGRSPDTGVSLADAAAPHLNHMDHVKVIQSGINSIHRFGHKSRPQFAQEELSSLVRLAHRHNLKVMVHANGETAVRSAIDAHCDSIEHGYFMGRDNLKRMAECAVVWVPTLMPMAMLAASEQLSTHQRDIARKTLVNQMGQIQIAHSLGVALSLGTDAGSPGVDHGQAVHGELELLISAGLSPEQAVQCTTATNARLMGQVRTGTLASGYRADFLVIPAPPDHLRQGLKKMTTLCHGGEWYLF